MRRWERRCLRARFPNAGEARACNRKRRGRHLTRLCNDRPARSYARNGNDVIRVVCLLLLLLLLFLLASVRRASRRIGRLLYAHFNARADNWPGRARAPLALCVPLGNILLALRRLLPLLIARTRAFTLINRRRRVALIGRGYNAAEIMRFPRRSSRRSRAGGRTS